MSQRPSGSESRLAIDLEAVLPTEVVSRKPRVCGPWRITRRARRHGWRRRRLKHHAPLKAANTWLKEAIRRGGPKEVTEANERVGSRTRIGSRMPRSRHSVPTA